MDVFEHKELLGAGALMFSFLKFVPAFWGMYTRTLTPHVMTVFLWSFPMAIIWAAQMVSGGGAGAWNTLVSMGLGLLQLALAFRFGYALTKITKFDSLVFAVACSAIPLWVIMKTPVYSVALIIFIETLGYLPTMRKSWTLPYEESIAHYMLGSLSWGLAILAATELNFVTVAYPLATILGNSALVALLVVRRQVMPLKQR